MKKKKLKKAKMKIPGLKYRSDNISVVELQPSMRTINFEGSEYRVSLPYIIFIISHQKTTGRTFMVRNLRVYFRFMPLTTKKDLLYYSCFPNVDGSVCLGDLGDEPNSFNTLDELCNFIVSYFLQSEFNDDTGFPLSDYMPGGGGCYYEEKLRKWEQMSSRNKEAYKELPTERINSPIADFCVGKPTLDLLA